MPVPSSLADLSTTAASNSPAGSDAIGTSLDDYLRTTQALLKQALSKGTDIASAGTIAIPNNGNYCVVTGTTTISNISDSWTGRVVYLKFSGDLTLTNSASLILPGGVSTTTVAGDTATFVNESTGVWRCIDYQRSTVGAGEASSGPNVSAFSFRNKIINGDMRIAQRGTSFAALAGGSYSLDRWLWDVNGAAVATVSQQVDAPSDNEFKNSLRVAVTTADATLAATDNAYLVQKIEGFNARDLIGKTFTLSFKVRSSKTGTHCVSFGSSNADKTYVLEYTVNAANTWESKSVTVTGGLVTSSGTWDWANGVGLRVVFALAAGSTFQATAGTWQSGNFLATSSQVNCLDTIGNIFAITGVQLEAGSVVTPFEHRPYSLELSLCQRYYSTLGGDYQMYCKAGFVVSVSATLPQPVRTNATVTYSTADSTNLSSLTLAQDYPSCVRLALTPAVGDTMVGWRGTLFFAAEL